MNAPTDLCVLPRALVVMPGGAAGVADEGGARATSQAEARALIQEGATLVVHAGLTARRLGAPPPPRSRRLFDILELFAFARPAVFCAPSAAGLAQALGLAAPEGPPQQARVLREMALALLGDLACGAPASRAEALALAETLGRAGWAWAELVIAALARAPVGRAWRGDGLDVWRRLPEWEERPAAPRTGSAAIEEEAAAGRLAELLGRAGLDEARPAQAAYARACVLAFAPRETEDEPRALIAEAGTGVGKTLGYLAPAALFARAGGAVWVSTYTRALQRQIERESRWLYADPAERNRKVVVRKGRENYLCLLNLQEALNAARLGGGDRIGLSLTARWVRASRDGDMTGGDFPAWLPSLFAISPSAQASPANLVDRRGECVHAACPHYRVCFVERSVRAARGADLVIANHALVMIDAALALAAGDAPPGADTQRQKRIVFDEGHHLFDAADQAFSACLSGVEAAELRRWIRGPEGRGRRGRGLEARLGDLLATRDAARAAMAEAVGAAAQLPGDGWSGRIAPADGRAAAPAGPVESFLAAIVEALRARAEPSDIAIECAARPLTDALAQAVEPARAAVAAIALPLKRLRGALADLTDEAADELTAADRARIEGALRGLVRRADLQLGAWAAMLAELAEGGADESRFVDWFEATLAQGRLVDAAFRRHWIDPTEPLAAAVLAPAHGVLVTSATLADPTLDDPFALARMRTGIARLKSEAKTVRLASPFAYPELSRVIVVTDVKRNDVRQVAAAMRELFLAAGGGALGLFTAIRRLRAVHQRIAAPLAEAGLALFAQHVDPLDAGSLVDIFRAEVDSCLLGADAVRDGIDVPGAALRLLVFDRAPWPRPDLLHQARRERFGGRGFDDAVARARIAQAFGRLTRRADDRGVFVMLDAATPSRLFASLPEGVEIERIGLVEAIEAVAAHVGPSARGLGARIEARVGAQAPP